MSTRQPPHAVRTELARQIRQRCQTYEEFVADAETFAREHGEPGTLSARHLQRLAAGQHRTVRPATARLLEHILGTSIDELLAPPGRTPGRPAGVPQPLRVAIAVVIKGEDVLLVRRRVDNGDGLTWQFPAGIIKPGDNPEAVAIRETLAETGVHCAIARHLGSRIHPTTGVYCEYLLCTYLAGEADNVDAAENAGVVWADRSRLAEFIPPAEVFQVVKDVLVVAGDLR